VFANIPVPEFALPVIKTYTEGFGVLPLHGFEIPIQPTPINFLLLLIQRQWFIPIVALCSLSAPPVNKRASIVCVKRLARYSPDIRTQTGLIVFCITCYWFSLGVWIGLRWCQRSLSIWHYFFFLRLVVIQSLIHPSSLKWPGSISSRISVNFWFSDLLLPSIS